VDVVEVVVVGEDIGFIGWYFELVDFVCNSLLVIIHKCIITYIVKVIIERIMI
jgi:hypothetical protein